MGGALLDRDLELSSLNRHVAAIRDGQGRVVVIEGAAGIGKSSLLSALARSAAAQGVRTVTARGGPLERDAIWGIARQLFDPIRDSTGDWGDLGSGAASLAARVLDPVAPEPALADDAMHAAVHGLVWLACNLAERGPTLLVIDDVHWCDVSSLRWLVALAHHLEDLPLGMLCAVRTGEPATDPDLLSELLAAAPEAPVRPRPLGIEAAQTLVAERLPAADARFARACHAVAGGNPFLLGALLSHLEAEGIDPSDETASRLSSFGPEQIARSVQRQLARLPTGADLVATALSVLGRRAPLRHVAHLSQRTFVEVTDLVDALRSAGLVSGGSEVALAHPLVAAAIYAYLPPGARARWHAQAAQLLTKEGVEVGQVALHLLHSDPRADPSVVATLRAAAAGATARGAPESAAGFLRRALDEPPADRATCADVRLELGLAQAAQWRDDALDILGEAVAETDAPARRARHASRAARALGMAGYFEEAFHLASLGLGDGAGIPAPDRERLDAELICDGMMQAQTHPGLSRRLRAAVKAPSALGLMTINAAQQLAFTGEPVEKVRELLALVVESGVLQNEPDSMLPTSAAIAMISSDDLTGALAWSAGLIDVARPRGWLVALAHASFLRSMALVRGGQIRSAEPDARLSLEFKTGNATPEGLMWALHTFIDVLTESDRLTDAEAALTEVDQLGDPPAGALGSPLFLQSRARLRLAQHRPDLAYADACEAGQRWRELSVCHPVMASWRVEAIQALVALGERDRCGALAREQLRLAMRLGTPAARATALCTLVEAGEVTDPVNVLGQAVDLAGVSSARLEHARTLVALGAALRRANQRAQARIPLRNALDLADRHGMLLLGQRARDELSATGARPRRPASTGPAALTPAEHHVADLACSGHTNRDIAGQLFVSRRTVETHLTHAFAKLQIAGRAELAYALAESRLEANVSK